MSGKPAKLPVRQLVILSICRFAEPVALQSVFPYLPEMIESFGVAENNVGKWVGIVAAVFSLSQCVTALFWARASDYFGRKPTILGGLAVTMLASLVFGFSKSLPQAIVARTIAGACSGTVGVIRTTVAEMVPQKELQPRAFSIMPLIWSAGSILGPMLGGAFARPAELYPGVFGDSELLKKFPYALPNIVTSAFFIIGLIIGPLFLKETLASKKHKKDYGLILGELLTKSCAKKRTKPRWLQDEEVSTSPQEGAKTTAATPHFSEVLTPQSNLNLLAYCVLALHSIAYDQLVPVFMHLKPQNREFNPDVRLPFKFAGGFGVDSGRIGLIFTIYGIAVMSVQFILFPPIARRYGVLNCLWACTITFPVAYFVTPFTVLLEDPIAQQAMLFLVMLIKGAGVIFAFPCVTIMLTNSARSLKLLGTLNGIAVSLSAIGRAFGPYMAGSLFTLGDDIGYIILPWFVLGVIGVIGHVCTYWLVELDGFGADSDDEDDAARSEDESHPARPLTNPGRTGAEIGEQAEVMDADAHAIDDALLEDESDNEDTPLLGRTSDNAGTRNRRTSNRSQNLPRLERQLSNPIGVREPIGSRRLSDALGHSNNGHGTA